MKETLTRGQIAALLDRFMAGETSLAEEQTLAEYFRTHEVDDGWRHYKEMFALFDSGQVDIKPQTAPTARLSAFPYRWLAAGIAAGIALLLWLKMPASRPVEEEHQRQEAALPIEDTERLVAEVETEEEPLSPTPPARPSQPVKPIQPSHPSKKAPEPEAAMSAMLPIAEPDPFLLAEAHARDIRLRGERLSREVAQMMNEH